VFSGALPEIRMTAASARRYKQAIQLEQPLYCASADGWKWPSLRSQLFMIEGEFK
jgi:hypothetical protein